MAEHFNKLLTLKNFFHNVNIMHSRCTRSLKKSNQMYTPICHAIDVIVIVFIFVEENEQYFLKYCITTISDFNWILISNFNISIIKRSLYFGIIFLYCMH